ncbi:MAG: B12-binding domain-containing radical SAM protein [Anaerolineales bacterium]|nr:B12-binding domain-containing radical SAM protein [Anaerolineales bacterium]
MRISLVTCFNADWFFGRIPSPYIPLNLLCLGAILRQHGHEVTIVDQTLALTLGKASDGPQFHQQVAKLILRDEPDLIGFTTMCNSYPQTLTLARHCREHNPEPKIVLGGPQATAVDEATLRVFPWVDAIVRGEADHTFPALVNHWATGQPLNESLLGITYRAPGGQIVVNPGPPLLQDMDALPYPAYDLYPVEHLNVSLIPIEAGRGCPFECTFCSTNLFFSRRYRIKSPERLIAEMVFLQETYGYSKFDLVHDMITVDARWVHKFSRALIDGGHKFNWGCSARVDCVDETLLAEMAEAGCIGVFFGIETGSQRLQPIVKKKLHVSKVMPTMLACLENNMAPTASFITGFPDETVDDAADSMNMALDVIHLAKETRGQMHLLAPLVGSPLYAKHKDELVFDGHSSDISLFLLTEEETQVVQDHPDVFPNFYYIPTPHMDRSFPKVVSATVYGSPNLMIALRHAGINLKDMLLKWVDWQYEHVNQEDITQDYFLYRFGLDFSHFLRTEVLPHYPQAPHLHDMVAYFEAKYALYRGHTHDLTLYYLFTYDVLYLNEMTRTNAPWPEDIQPKPTGVLFVNLMPSADKGFVFLEVPIPQTDHPVVQPGDILEIRDPATQLRNRPNLIIRNNTQQRIFATRHNMTEIELMAAGFATA